MQHCLDTHKLQAAPFDWHIHPNSEMSESLRASPRPLSALSCSVLPVESLLSYTACSLHNDFSEGWDPANPSCWTSCDPTSGQNAIALVDGLSYDAVWGAGHARTFVSPTAWQLCDNDLAAAQCVYANADSYHSAVYFRHGARSAVIGAQVLLPAHGSSRACA